MTGFYNDNGFVDRDRYIGQEEDQQEEDQQEEDFDIPPGAEYDEYYRRID